MRKRDELIESVKQNIIRHDLVKCGNHILIGLSGGADSVFLLYVLAELRREMGYSLSAIHVNHGIRGAEAERDQEFSKRLCRSLGIQQMTIWKDVPGYAAEHRLGLEEAARILRYEAFAEECDRLRAAALVEDDQNLRVLIAVAHHADDQAETMLHHLIRGTGIRGLGGMGWKRGDVIRPLLSITREDILKWLDAQGADYVTDSSNMDEIYTRNRFRQKIIPEMKKINTSAVLHIAKTAEILRETDQYFRQQAEKFVDETVYTESEAVVLPVEHVRGLPEVFRIYIIALCIQKLEVPLKDWGSVHYQAIDRLIMGPGNRHLDLPRCVSVDYQNKTLRLSVEQEVISMKRRKKHGTACQGTDI